MKLLTTKQAANILCVTPSRIRQFILANRLPAQKIGRDLFILEKNLKFVSKRKPGRPKNKKTA